MPGVRQSWLSCRSDAQTSGLPQISLQGCVEYMYLYDVLCVNSRVCVLKAECPLKALKPLYAYAIVNSFATIWVDLSSVQFSMAHVCHGCTAVVLPMC